ncbi:hypothetical protein Tco_0237350 [Tanacetum coccineum]
MDSIIPLGQKNTLAEYMILSDADNRPPMLDKDLTKKYVELSTTKKIQADCDMKATNIIIQGLPADIYSPEIDCKLYDAFDMFAHIKGESLHKYYLRFTQLINDMNIYKMKLEQFQVNTKFLNSLPLEWSKFVTDVKLVKDLHTTNYDQLHAYLEKHELHANEVCIMREHNQDPFDLLRNSSNLKQQATIHDGRVTVQPLQGRKNSYVAGEGHMARQCLKPKRKRDATWFKDKVLLVKAQGNGKLMNEEEFEFLADPGVAEAKAVLMANLSSYGLDVLSEVPHSDNTYNDMINQSTQEMQYSEQTHLVNYPENEITTERYKELVKLLEERQNVDLVTREKLIIDDIIPDKDAQFTDFEKEINSLKQTLSEQLKEKESLTKTFNVFKNESKEKEAKNTDNEIALEKKVKELNA